MKDLDDRLKRLGDDITPEGLSELRPTPSALRSIRIGRAIRGGAALAAVVIVAMGGFAGARSLTNDKALPPAERDSKVSPFADTWTTTDAEGRTRTMLIRASGKDAYEVTVDNHLAHICSGASSTLTGSGRVFGSRLTVISLEITCDDGSEPKVEDDLPPPDELLASITFEYDPKADILSNFSPLELRRVGEQGQAIYSGITLVWGRADAENRFEDVGGWITYGDRDGIWARDVTNPGDPSDRVSVNSASGTPIAWSPDGSKLLVLREVPRGADAFPHTDLFLLNRDGTETRLTEADSWLDGGSFSPDGTEIVYATGEAIHLIDAEGGSPRLVRSARDDSIVEAATFSPDGNLIAYFEGAGDHSNVLWVMNADGTDSRILLEREFGHIRGLKWSPDGARLAFSSGGIWVVDADGSGLRQVSSEEIDGTNPHWSPDGSYIAYTRADQENPAGGSLEIIRLGDLQVQNFGDGRSGPWAAEV